MKKLQLLAFAVWIALTLSTAYAQNLSQQHLPEGAKMRLGKGQIYALQFSPDGTQLKVASGSGIWHYDTQTGHEGTWVAWSKNINTAGAAIFSPDGRVLASGGWANSEVHLWDVRTGALHKTLAGHTGIGVYSVSFSPDGRMLASGGNWEDPTVRLWDVETGALLKTLTGHPRPIWSVSFSPDGRMLASGGGWKNPTRLWDVETGTLLKTLTGNRSDVHSVAFSPDGRILASGGVDILLWDVRTGALLKTLTGHKDSVSSVAFSPDGRTLASGGGWEEPTHLWDVETGTLRRTLEGHKGYFGMIAFSPDGTTLAGGISDIHLWDVRTGAPLKTITGHTTSVWRVAFSPDGTTLASGSGDSTIRLWDVRTGAPLRTITAQRPNNILSIAFSPDGTTLASGTTDTTIRLWDVGTGAPLKPLTGHTGKVSSVAFSPDGTTLASVSSDKTIRLWDLGTGTLRKTFHTESVADMAFSPDGTTLASTSFDNIQLWDVRTGVSRERLTKSKFGNCFEIGVTFSPDGTTLANNVLSGVVQLWDVLSGEHQRTLSVLSVIPPVFSPDGGFLAIGAHPDTVFLMDLAAGEAWGESLGYHTALEDIAFSPDGRTLASGGYDGTILLWDVTPYTSQFSEPDSPQPQRDSVQLVYLRPSDRTSQQNIDAKLNAVIKNVQNFYAAQMHRHERKTFTLETDADGNAVVHHVDGKFADTYYQTDTYNKVKKEIGEQFDLSEDIYLVAIDVSNELLTDGGQRNVCGIGGGSWYSSNNETWHRHAGGLVVIPASGHCFTVGVTAHELGHTFGLDHDFRDETYLMGYGNQSKLSTDAAEWLSLHRYFNTGQTGFDWETTLTVLSSRASGLKFQVSDADGLHQVQLLIPTTAGDPASGMKLHSSEALNGETDSTVTFAVSELTGGSEVTLQVIDMHGHITKQTFPVETDSVTEVTEGPVDGNVAVVRLSPASVWSGNIGDHLTVNATIAEGVDVRGYQVELTFDSAALRFVSSADGGYLPAGAFQVPPVSSGNSVTFAATSLQVSSEGDGTLAAFTFEVLTTSPGMPTLSDVKLTDSAANFLAVRIETPGITDSSPLAGDVNGDGVVDLTDITAAAGRLGQTGENTADMNNDGIVDAADLLLIAAAIEAAAAAPALFSADLADMFTATEVRQWLAFARAAGLTGGAYQRGFLLLEQLLLLLTPKETLLLANYPNPFNPETWIPYHLSEPADVTISIYTADGRLVRMLPLGHQGAGMYESRGRAGYWDGRNALGEPVASGVYFYTFTAGEFTATRKMLIRK